MDGQLRPGFMGELTVALGLAEAAGGAGGAWLLLAEDSIFTFQESTFSLLTEEELEFLSWGTLGKNGGLP